MRYAVLVFLSGCSYGILSTIVKFAYAAGLTPAEVCGGQTLLGMIFLWLMAARRGIHVSGRKALTLVIGGMSIGCTTMFYYTSLETVPASFAVILMFQFVWMSAVLESLAERRLPGWQKILAIVILLPGSMLAAGVVGSDEPFVWSSGVFWGLASAVSYALVLFISGTVACDVQPELKSALMATGALLIIFLVMPPAFLLSAPAVCQTAPYAILLGIFGIVLPQLLFSIGIPHTGAALGSILSSSELPVSILMAFFVLGEPVTVLQWLGSVLILAGVVIGNLGKRRTT